MDLIPVIYTSLGALLTGVFSIISATTIARAQKSTARERAMTDINLQNARLKDAALSNTIAIRSAKLEKIYAFFSEMQSQCSQTQTQIHRELDSTSSDVVVKWDLQRSQIPIIRADIAIYFPEMSDMAIKLYSELNTFYLELMYFLPVKRQSNQVSWDSRYQNIMASSNNIFSQTRDIQEYIQNNSVKLLNNL